VAGGRFVPDDPARTKTLKQALDDYEEGRKELRGYAQEKHRIEMFWAVPWADLPLASIRPTHISSWIVGRRKAGISNGTILNDIKVLTTLFNCAPSARGSIELAKSGAPSVQRTRGLFAAARLHSFKSSGSLT